MIGQEVAWNDTQERVLVLEKRSRVDLQFPLIDTFYKDDAWNRETTEAAGSHQWAAERL